MNKTKVVQFRVDKYFFEKILNQTSARGYKKYSDYLRKLCVDDSLYEQMVMEKLNKIIERLEYSKKF
jgi:hypothetical protein